ncbi:MAG: spore cortex biosynthesis protein YabQ [Ruminococcus sp.]|nr:spore cortex biosynthesis protein YabQ [Ruminococcus sp.]
MNLETFLSVTKQTELFLLAVTLGAGLGIIFDALRVLRIIIKTAGNAFFCGLADVLFTLFSAFCIFLFSAETARGQVRFFIVIGAALGFLLEILTTGDIVTGVVKKAANAVRAELFRIINGFRRLQKSQQSE